MENSFEELLAYINSDELIEDNDEDYRFGDTKEDDLTYLTSKQFSVATAKKFVLCVGRCMPG